MFTVRKEQLANKAQSEIGKLLDEGATYYEHSTISDKKIADLEKQITRLGDKNFAQNLPEIKSLRTIVQDAKKGIGHELVVEKIDYLRLPDGNLRRINKSEADLAKKYGAKK
jgi:hypothetical protein